MQDDLISIQIPYGRDGKFSTEILKKRLMLHHVVRGQVQDVSTATHEAIHHPIDFPALERALVPGDHIVVVMDRDTPQGDLIFAEIWKLLSASGIEAEDVLLLEPAVWKSFSAVDPRSQLSSSDQESIQLHRHDPTKEESCSYLATTASGERVYLSRLLTDADFVLTIGPVEYDPVLGFRGTSSSLFPGLSNIDSIRRTQGQGHDELGPDDARPLRQMTDEIGWLLGLQFSVAVIPAEGTKVQQIIAGHTESVTRHAHQALKEHWLIQSQERAEQVIVAIPEDAAGHGWDQVAAAIDVARRLVERNGRIIVLSQLEALPGPGLDILRQVHSPRDALRPIQKASTPDLIAASRIASAVDWANVYLLSKLDSTLVDELFLIPVESETEVQRLLQSDEITVIVEGAQHAFTVTGA